MSSESAPAPLAVVAVGGNALLRPGQIPDVENQRANLMEAADALAEIALDHRLVVTHGNGPQVGMLALQAEAAQAEPPPLDVIGAETEGLIGYLLDQELGNRISHCDVVTLLTQVIVDPADPAFEHPTKPIGPVYSEAVALSLAADRGWLIVPDRGGWRRAVPSPEPIEIVELSTIRLLTDAAVVVVCSGGGGIPVVRDERGALRGVEAVIDKDLASALLASLLDADLLVMLTDVPAVMDGWGGPDPTPLGEVTAGALRRRSFSAGSMGPKVEAACRFVEAGGRRAAIGALESARQVADGESGTQVYSGDDEAPG